jgi:plastocyanin
MKRNRLTFLAGLLLFGLFVLALSVQSVAQDSKKEKPAPKDVKFACSQHGPTDMTLTLTLDTGKPRKIEFVGGGSATRWFVKIDGKDENVKNGETVKVRPGDSITWSVEKGTHGVVFAEQDLAQAVLDFDMKVGKPLVDQTTRLTTNAWKKFGTKRWGTDPTSDVGVLASCKVKEAK